MKNYAYMNDDNTVNHIGAATIGIAWRNETIGDVGKLTKPELMARLIYECFPPAARPTETEEITGITHDIDPAAGTVQERYLTAPLPLAEVQSRLIARTKREAAMRLQPTDWKIIRAAEGAQPCSPETLAYRAAVREAGNAFEAAVLAADSVADLQALPPASWPPLA